ncbi:hypothetical protein KY284_015919 [Solanum tuberosum]|nr:hypothetical protein KY284_015919 [Solanum tuberosum]
MHSGRWNEENCYVDYTIEAIIMKEYATCKDLVDEVAKQIGVDLRYNCLKLKYKIEGSNAPLEIRNEMGVRVYVSLKKENKELAKYPICVTVFVKDCELTDRNLYEDGVDMSGIDKGDTIDTQALVLSAPLVSNAINNEIISNINQTEVMEDQVYKDKGTLKAVMRKYAIDHRFQWKTDRSSEISYTLVCVSDNCGWIMKSSNINKSGMFRIRMFVDEHTCPLKDKVYSQRQATSSLVGGIIKPKLVDHKRKLTPNDIQVDIKMDLGVDVSYSVAWKAKEKAINALRGAPSDSYSFESCRPIVVVDGSHLRGTYNGTFVSASTLDGAASREAHGLKDNMCVVSDRNESIIKSVSRTLYKKSHYSLSEVYYAMAKAYRHSDFDDLMKKVEQVDIRVKNYLELAGYEKWARVYATVNRGSVITSNIAECINSCLVVARELLIYDFLEEVRQMFGQWNFTNHTSASSTFTTLCGKAQEMLAENEERSVRMTVVATSNYVHNVHHEGSTFIVCLERKTCTCRRFQMDEIPCSHAWAVLKKKFLDPEPELYGKKYKNYCSTCGCKGHNRRSCRNGPRTE